MKYKAIIVDDEPWIRDVIKRLGYWEKLGIEVVGEASDGAAGLQLAEEFQPHIIITDMRMPSTDGVALMKSILIKKPKIKVIVISGYDDYNYMREAIRYSAMDYLLKPVDPDALNKLLEKCVIELDEENVHSNEVYEPDSFLNVDWLSDYIKSRSLLAGFLKDLNALGSTNEIDYISSMVIEHEGKKVSMGIVMKIYYDLVWLLEQFTVNSGYAMAQLLKKNSKPFAFSAKTTLNDMMNYLKEVYSCAIDNMMERIRNRNRIDMDEIQKYVDNSYMDNITLESVASRFYVSKEYLSKMFKNHAGMNFSDYMKERRMEKAREMLVQHGLQIKNVAELLGFNDIAHFYKIFKKYHGITPGEMRKKVIDK